MHPVHRAHYCDGCLVSIAHDVVGPWLATLISLSAAVSCVGLFIAEMASDSFQIMGMADNGQLPSALGVRSPFGTPTAAIIFSAVGCILASPLDFTAIIEAVNCIYVFAELLEIAAFIKLRRDRPDMPRPWKVPVETLSGIVMLFGPAAIFLLAVVAFSSLASIALAFGVMLFNTALYFFVCVAREEKWVAFEAIDASWSMKDDPAWVQAAVASFSRALTRFRRNGDGGDNERTALAANEKPDL